MKALKHWYDYLWIVTILYLGAGFFNILSAWLGLIFFFVPLIVAVAGGGKAYCNRYCDRGQFLDIIGKKLKLSRKKDIPTWLKSKAFRYGFLAFFMFMFFNMIYITWLVFSGAGDLKEFVTLLWTWKLPWEFAYTVAAPAPWVAQFAFGFYSLMLTSTILGVLTGILFKPRSWCVYCPMGTMTQLVCKAKNKATKH